jgi:hypothetical protein
MELFALLPTLNLVMKPVFVQLDRLHEDDKFLQRTQAGWSPILGYQRDQPLL